MTLDLARIDGGVDEHATIELECLLDGGRERVL